MSDPTQPLPPADPPREHSPIEIGPAMPTAADPAMPTAAGPPMSTTANPATTTAPWPDTAMLGPVSTVEPAPPKRRGRRAAVIAAGAALLVLVASGTAVARLWFASTGTLPEQVVPGSTAAFLRINLTPGYGQRVKVLALLNKFPVPAQKAGGGSGTGALDAYTSKLVKGLDLSLDDVKGWFDDRAGIGVWTDGRGRPVVLAALATNDDGAARKALGAARAKAGSDHLGFVVSGGYALLTRSDKGAQAAADDAARAAAKASLAQNTHFRTAVAALPSDEAVLAYADLAQIGTLTTARPGLGAVPPSPGAAKLTGYVVSGAQAVDDGIEIRGRSMGVTPQAGGPRDARADLGAIPANSALAAVTGGLGDSTSGFGRLGSLFGTWGFDVPGSVIPGLSTGNGTGTGTGQDPANADPTDPTADPTDAGGPMPSVGADGKLHLVGPDGKKIVIDPNDPSTFPSDGAFPGPMNAGPMDGGPNARALDDASTALLAALGTASSIRLAVADTPAKGQDLPALAVTVQLTDDAAAKTFTDNVAKLTATGMAVPPGALTVTQHGSAVQAQTRGYAAGGGTLSGSALFDEAMAGAPAAPSTAVYLDVHKFAAVDGASADTMRRLGPVKAIGLTAGRAGNDGVILVHIVIR